MAETFKDYSHIEIKSQEPAADESLQEQKIRFFGSRSRGKENTWVISFFVVLHVVAFAATMFINNCSTNSHGDCALRTLGRLSFQPLKENPFLGPSSSTMYEMGALRRTFVIQQHQIWRLVTCLWLHAGFIHLIINLSCVILIGIRLEQMFGPFRIGIIYMLSAFLGGLVSALFVQNGPAIGSSGALFGLLGAMLSGLIMNWKIYIDKFAVLLSLFLVATINFSLGLLPYVDNFSNIGGFQAGFLLGFVLLFNPQLRQMAQNKKGLFEYDVKNSVKLKHKLDKPAIRCISLVLFVLIFTGCLVAVLHGVNANKYCSWCHYVNCVPFKGWICNEEAMQCEVLVNGGRLTLTCESNGNFHIYPFTNISQARIEDLCSLICS